MDANSDHLPILNSTSISNGNGGNGGGGGGGILAKALGRARPQGQWSSSSEEEDEAKAEDRKNAAGQKGQEEAEGEAAPSAVVVHLPALQQQKKKMVMLALPTMDRSQGIPPRDSAGDSNVHNGRSFSSALSRCIDTKRDEMSDFGLRCELSGMSCNKRVEYGTVRFKVPRR